MGCEGARNSQDDIIIWWSSQIQLEIRTEQVLNRIQKSDSKLNKDKCLFEATKWIFLEHKISGKGFLQIQKKLGQSKACLSHNLSKVMQSFLGMIADLSKFISQLSEQTHQLRELVKKNSNWDFTVTHAMESNLKNWDQC